MAPKRKTGEFWWSQVDVGNDYRPAQGGCRTWKCHYCGIEKFSGSDRVRYHLLGITGKNIRACDVIPPPTKEALKKKDEEEYESRGIRRLTTPVGSSSPSPCSTPRPLFGSSSASGNQATLKATWNPLHRGSLDQDVGRFFWMCNIPFNVAASPYFKAMVKGIANFGSTYESPHPKVIGGRLLLKEKEDIEAAISPIREGWSKNGCSLIGDGWSDVRRRPLQGLIVSSRGKSFFVKAYDSSGHQKTSENLVTIWANGIDYVGAPNVVQFISDSEASNKRAGMLLESRYPHIFWTPCVAHGLNNLMKDIGGLPWIAPTIQKGRDVVTFIYRHHYSLALYREFAKKELLKYVETRFAYNFLMLYRLFDMRHELRQLVVSSQWVGWENSRSSIGLEVTSSILSSEFWDEVELLNSIVGPINKMMRLVDGDTPCMGKVYEGMDRVIEHIQGLDLDESKITSIKEMCIKRWDQFHVPLYAAAYILDPEFQGKGQERDREVVRGWEKVLDRLIPMENHRKVEELCRDEVDEDVQAQLESMGFLKEHILTAINACGKECDIFVISDFIEAHYGCRKKGKYHDDFEECFGGLKYKKENTGQVMDGMCETETKKDVGSELAEMGYCEEEISDAINACGRESDIFVLSDFIQAHYGCKVEDHDFSKPDSVYSEIETDNWVDKRLQSFGFHLEMIKEAKISSGSDEFTCLLNYLLEQNKGNPGLSETGEIKEDVETQMEKMGYTTEQISIAINACGKECDIFTLSDFIQAHFELEEKEKESENSEEDCVFVETETETEAENENEGEVSTTIRLQKMGFHFKEIQIASRSCGNDFDDLLDFLLENEKSAGLSSEMKSKKASASKSSKRRKEKESKVEDLEDTPEVMYFGGGPMVGFGVPGFPILRQRRKPLNPMMEGPPYFYFENVASMPKGEWETIQRHFNGVETEFVDSQYLSVSRRARGYVHNLPIEGRERIVPLPPMTITEAFPETEKYWPEWDKRTKFNCIHSRRGTDQLCGRIRSLAKAYQGAADLPPEHLNRIIKECKFWNLVWVGPSQVAPLEPHEIELILGFDRDHTRGSFTATERYEGLGNSFQIDTVGLHLSVLRPLFPSGIRVLSLFSGIGGAEVALHRLGIYMKTVVITEIDPKARNVIATWWKKSKQKGQLICKEDVRELSTSVLEDLIDQVGGFDLIIGGSPCSNLSGNNRVSRVGLEGSNSVLFYEFPRILTAVKQIMEHKRCI